MTEEKPGTDENIGKNETRKKDVNRNGDAKKAIQDNKKASGEQKSKNGKGDSSDAKKPESKAEANKEASKDEKKAVPAKSKPKKTEAVVNSRDLPLSLKESVAVCRFIKGKKIDNAVADLEMVIAGKKAVPMKGEIPHRKGRIMSGRYPKKSAMNFIKVLKGLSGNAIANGIENPVIVEAVANSGRRPYGRFGSVRRKSVHLRIIAKKNKSSEIKKT